MEHQENMQMFIRTFNYLNYRLRILIGICSDRAHYPTIEKKTLTCYQSSHISLQYFIK